MKQANKNPGDSYRVAQMAKNPGDSRYIFLSLSDPDFFHGQLMGQAAASFQPVGGSAQAQ